jgi:hypothetical protein
LDNSAGGENTMSRPSSHHLLLARSEATVDGARVSERWVAWSGCCWAAGERADEFGLFIAQRERRTTHLLSLSTAAGPTVPADSILCWIKDSAEIISVIRKLLGRRKDYMKRGVADAMALLTSFHCSLTNYTAQLWANFLALIVVVSNHNDTTFS